MSYLTKFLTIARSSGYGRAIGAGGRFLLRQAGVPLGLRPYEYVQREVQRHLHHYLGVEASRIQLIVIVGAHLGYEARDMLTRFSAVHFILFEASPRYADALRTRFAGEGRVLVHESAVAESDGELRFHETNIEGSGSLLAVGPLATRSYGTLPGEDYTVHAVRLDAYMASQGDAERAVDCLWVDVQGAELLVLRGARATLRRTKSVFIEVSMFEPLYEGGAVYADLARLLGDEGFSLVMLGTDPQNGTGNAFFVRSPG